MVAHAANRWIYDTPVDPIKRERVCVCVEWYLLIFTVNRYSAIANKMKEIEYCPTACLSPVVGSCLASLLLPLGNRQEEQPQQATRKGVFLIRKRRTNAECRQQQHPTLSKNPSLSFFLSTQDQSRQARQCCFLVLPSLLWLCVHNIIILPPFFSRQTGWLAWPSLIGRNSAASSS